MTTLKLTSNSKYDLKGDIEQARIAGDAEGWLMVIVRITHVRKKGKRRWAELVPGSGWTEYAEIEGYLSDFR
jgi:hypothetical protein